MNHCVPDFEIQMEDHQYPIPFSSAFPHPNKPDDGIMELLWQNGPVVLPSQTQRPLRKPPPLAREIPPENYHNQHLFMQEDEMASWLHYPIVDDDDSPLDHNFCADLLYSPPTANNDSTMQSNARTSQVTELRKPSSSVAPRPPIPPARRPEQVHESVHLSKHNVRVEQGRSSSRIAARESTVVDSCETPAAATAAASASRVSETVRSLTEPTEGDAWRGSMSTAGVTAPSTTTAGVETGGKEATTCDTTATSSPGGSSCSADVADRKRKGREAEDSECPSEDLDYESAEAKKLIRKTTSTKRSRAAEVHNLSERKRRDRINEKMRALQELIPRCNKSDKASMLDEAIEYLKSLQLQVQMMSMGCGMVPISMMYPGMQQYMPAMGMEMGMNRAVMSFPNMLAASALPAAAAHLGPRFPVAPLHMPHVELSRMQAAKQSSNMLTSLPTSDPTHSRIPNLTDPYLQYFGPHLIQFQLMQNQAMIQQNVSKSSTSRGPEDPENHQSENR